MSEEREDDTFGTKRVMYEQNRTTIDGETGAVIESKNDSLVKIPQTPDFVMAFTRDLGYLKNISGGASKLLFGLIQSVDRNNEITLNKARKNKIAQNCGLKENSIDALLNQLKKKEVVIQIDRGIYQLNPYLFGKGKWKNVQKMRMEIEYDFTTQTKKVNYGADFGVDEDEPNLLDYGDPDQPFFNNP